MDSGQEVVVRGGRIFINYETKKMILKATKIGMMRDKCLSISEIKHENTFSEN